MGNVLAPPTQPRGCVGASSTCQPGRIPRALAFGPTAPLLEAMQDTQAGGFSQAFGEQVSDQILPLLTQLGP